MDKIKEANEKDGLIFAHHDIFGCTLCRIQDFQASENFDLSSKIGKTTFCIPHPPFQEQEDRGKERIGCGIQKVEKINL